MGGEFFDVDRLDTRYGQEKAPLFFFNMTQDDGKLGIPFSKKKPGRINLVGLLNNSELKISAKPKTAISGCQAFFFE